MVSVELFRAKISAEAYVNQLVNSGRLSESRRQTEIDSIIEQKLAIIGLVKKGFNNQKISSRVLARA